MKISFFKFNIPNFKSLNLLTRLRLMIAFLTSIMIFVSGALQVFLQIFIMHQDVRIDFLANVILVSLLGGGSGYFISGPMLRKILTDRLSKIVTALARVGEGDLTQELPEDSEDEIGLIARSTNWTRQCFQMTVKTLRETAQQVNAMSQEVSEILENQVAASTGQSTAVVESTTSLEELTRSAQQNTESAGKVVGVAEETLMTGQIGTEAINSSAERINQISEQNRVNLEKLSSLRKQFTKIAEVASFITEMAYQTRLIAFNATLKAAEGGEAGKTFGVIAREIRGLADNVAGYAREIHTHIAEIRDATNDLTIAAENTTRRIEEGQVSNEEAQHAFAKIVAEVQKTTESAHYISQSSLQQQEACEQFLTVFREIAHGARSLADGSQQARDSVARLVEFAGSGAQIVSNFKLE